MSVRIRDRIQWIGLLWLLVNLGWLFAGCQSTPKVDWNSRVGTYTFDQAVMELGPPDRVTPLSDGSQVAAWITRGSSGGLTIGTGFSNGRAGMGVSRSFGPGYNDRVLQLTFGPDQKLTSWSKNY